MSPTDRAHLSTKLAAIVASLRPLSLGVSRPAVLLACALGSIEAGNVSIAMFEIQAFADSAEVPPTALERLLDAASIAHALGGR